MKVKISNLPLWINETEVKRHFENFGEILSSLLMFDAKGKSTGKAEIIFYNDLAAFNALSMHGRKIHGSAINVDLIT